ncbi:class I SAM-dependent methyltransferase [Streptosporangium sandarakinum]
MSVDSTYATGTRATAGALVEEFTAAPDAGVREAYRRLVEAVWDGGTLTGLALPAASEIVDGLDRVGEDRAGLLAVLLGLLAEAEAYVPDSPVRAAVRQGMDRYLDLLDRCEPDEPLAQGLIYLLAHFPEDRDRILAQVSRLELPVDDLSRLDRCLRELDPADPDLGRVWPAPSVWRLTDEERAFDKAWIASLSPEQITVNWRNDTRNVWAYMGAKAYWTVRDGVPAAIPRVPHPADTGATVPSAAEAGPELLRPHAAAFRCPACHDGLDFGAGGVRCERCAVTYPVTRGILDLTEGISDAAAGTGDEASANLLRKLAEMPTMGLYYEALMRPEFLRVAGSNWDAAVTPAAEDAYIAAHVRPVDGPVLDLAAGAGRWTGVIAQAVGAERLVALDMGLPMLNTLRGKLPEVPAVRASALELPFEDASLGAVVCWNALQAFPDDAGTAIAEVGRCLRPGGTFTLMTFVWDTDPVYRHFQAAHSFPGRPAGMLLFEAEQLRTWLAEAGMVIREESGSGTFVFITAERAA